VEAEAFEGLIEVFGVLEGWGFAVDHYFFAFGSGLLELNHSVFPDFLL
jgi:hypothetical protein